MPPKKKQEEVKKVVLGRLSHSLSAGIVGMPNVGKSTFFNILTKSAIPAENFPFCTIDPNSSRVAVPDARFDWLVEHFKPASVVPAFLNVTDIAGLVRGAAEGEGLGNAFLSHIQAVDGIIHLVRGFDDPDVVHVENSVDPIRDLEIIHGELLAKDIAYVNTRFAQLENVIAKGIDKSKKAEFEIVTKIRDFLVNEGKEIRMGTWSPLEIEVLNTMQLLTAKTAVYLVNISKEDFLRQKNKWLPKVKAWVDERTSEPVIPFSAAFEAAIFDMPEDEKAAYLTENKVKSMLPHIIKSVYHSLNLIHFFTAGEDEVRAWTIRDGSKAPQAAGRIHTDFERGFICAEVMAFDDLKELGSIGAVKAGGKLKQQGRNYDVVDGDIIEFRFNVAPKKK
nr:Obg-like ATPase 1 [Seculamonas ecuadoriensis]